MAAYSPSTTGGWTTDNRTTRPSNARASAAASLTTDLLTSEKSTGARIVFMHPYYVAPPFVATHCLLNRVRILARLCSGQPPNIAALEHDSNSAEAVPRGPPAYTGGPLT